MTPCWAGTSSAFESLLLAPFSTYALEQLRQRFMFTLTTTHDLVKGARVLLQMAFETEINAILIKQITLDSDVLSSNVCERRRFIDVDKDMQLQGYLVTPALDEVQAPAPYVDFVRFYVSSEYPRYRMCAIASAICLAKANQ